MSGIHHTFLFLLSYALFAEMVWMVLASGIFDFLIGVILVWFDHKMLSGGE